MNGECIGGIIIQMYFDVMYLEEALEISILHFGGK